MGQNCWRRAVGGLAATTAAGLCPGPSAGETVGGNNDGTVPLKIGAEHDGAEITVTVNSGGPKGGILRLSANRALPRLHGFPTAFAGLPAFACWSISNTGQCCCWMRAASRFRRWLREWLRRRSAISCALA